MPTAPDYALDVLTLVESILENPELILRKQLDRVKDRAVAQMKAEGVEYEERMEELEKLEYPKPLRDFVYETFNAFADRHPWVGEENIRPKSIAREMFENFRSFAEYVRDYELQRSEGLLLRHLNSVYKVLSQTVPDGSKTDEVGGHRAVPRAPCCGRSTRASRTSGSACATPATGRSAGGTARRGPPPRGAGRAARHHARREGVHRRDPHPHLHLPARLGPRPPRGGARRARPGRAGRGRRLGLDRRAAADGSRPTVPITERCASTPRRATSGTRTSIGPAAPRAWLVQQVLVDAEQHNDWMAEFEVDLAASREADRPVLWLRALQPIA